MIHLFERSNNEKAHTKSEILDRSENIDIMDYKIKEVEKKLAELRQKQEKEAKEKHHKLKLENVKEGL